MWAWLSGRQNASPAPSAGSSTSNSSIKDMFNFGGKMAYKKQAEARKPSDYDYLIKLLLVGDSGVGKSCLLLRFEDNSFFAESFISTIGVDFKIKTVNIDGRVVKLQLWDTTGQERFRSISSSYYRGAHGILMVYDSTNAQSYAHLPNWLSEIERYGADRIAKTILGNKCDMDTKIAVDPAEANAFAEAHGCGFFETSAKTGVGVQEAFMACAREALKLMGEDVAAPHYPAPASREVESKSGNPFDNEDSDEESFSDDDLEADMAELIAKDPKKRESSKSASVGEKEDQQKNKKKHKKTDVNVFRLDLTSLEQETELMTGDPVACQRCGVMLSARSVVTPLPKKEFLEKVAVARERLKADRLVIAPPITEKYMHLIGKEKDEGGDAEDGESVQCWVCEFCGGVNRVDLGDVEEEKPHASVVDYLVATPVSAAKKDKEGEEEAQEEEDASNIVFCIDISGSMCVTQEVPGKHNLKGAARREREIQELSRDAGQQYLPGRQRHNVSHISRLQCVQAAIEAQIERLAVEHPNKRVSLITFNDEVTLLGDGEQESVVVAGEKLDSWDDLVAVGNHFRIHKTVKESKDELLKKLWSLEETGATALGPAMLLGIMVAGARPRSQMILCTDGLANMGVGSLEGKEADYTPIYTECAEQAKLKGVTVSVITLVGTDCNVENLSVVTEQTGGAVERVDPLKLTAGGVLSSLLNSTRVLAYGVMAMVCLHRGLQFKGEMADEQENRNWLVKDLANVTADTECVFRYGFRPKSEYDMSELSEVPFQVQLLFTRPDGMQYLRVATTSIELTSDRHQAERNADVKVIGNYAAQRAARYAKQGDYEAAQLEARAAQRFMLRNEVRQDEVMNWTEKVESLDKVLRKEQKKEREQGLQGLDGEEAKKMRKAMRNDDTASEITSLL